MIPQAQPLPGGLVVLFEGIDGVGKTSQVNLAHAALEAADWPVLSTRNLGGTPIGEALRETILSSLKRPALTDFYISLAIQEALLEVIDEARTSGKIILMDRGPLSLAAYQIYGGGVDKTMGWQHVDEGMKRLHPELSILYTSDVKQAVERGRQRAGKADYFESKPLHYFEQVAQGYEAAGERYPLHTVDAGQSIQLMHTQTMELIQKTLQEKLKQSQI